MLLRMTDTRTAKLLLALANGLAMVSARCDALERRAGKSPTPKVANMAFSHAVSDRELGANSTTVRHGIDRQPLGRRKQVRSR